MIVLLSYTYYKLSGTAAAMLPADHMLLLLLQLLLALLAQHHALAADVWAAGSFCPKEPVLLATCGGAQRASVGNCLLCMAHHFFCPPVEMDRFCAIAPSPESGVTDVWRYMEDATPWGTATHPQNFSCFRCPAVVALGWANNQPQRLMAFAEARTWAGDGCLPVAAPPTPYRNFSLVMKVSADGGRTWSSNTIVDGGLNPAAVYDASSGYVIVHYASACNSVTAGAVGMCTYQQLCEYQHNSCHSKIDLAPALGEPAMNSTDCALRGRCNGASPGPGNGIQLVDGPKSGRLLFAGHLGFTDVVWYSDDHAQSWTRSKTVVQSPFNDSVCEQGAPCFDEPTVVQRPDGHVILNMRSDSSKSGHSRFEAHSSDGGGTFGAVAATPGLTEPPTGCQASMTRGGAGNMVLYFCNPSWAGGRTQLSVRRSTDGALTWAHCTEQQRMEDGGCAGVRTIEVNQSSYSSLTAMGANQLGVLYERGPAWGDKGCSGVSCRISFTTIDALLTPPPTTTLKLDDDAAAVTLIWDIDKSATVNTPAGVLRGDRGLSCTERWCDGQNGNATNIYGHVGLYPDLTRAINGGIPQKGNLSAHLEKFRVDFAALVPSPDYRGFCLLDFEQFRGDWNSTPDAYRAASVAAAGGNETLGKLQYETAAKAFMLGTIAAVKAVRPGCKTGYYGYPRNDLPTAAGVSPSFKKYCDAHPFDCTFAGYGHGAAGDAQRALNDELHWLFEASTAIFPSIYLGVLPEDAAHHSVANNTRYIQQTVEEAIRLSSADKVVPVTWYLYDNYPRSPHWHSLSAGDLRTELEVPLQAGAKALLLWGATSNTTAGIGNADLQEYVNQTLSPLVAEICAKYGCLS